LRMLDEFVGMRARLARGKMSPMAPDP